MSDLVERLRDSQPEGTTGGYLLNDAADELERLRAENATLREALRAHGEEAEKWVSAEPVATAWMRDGKMINAFPHPPDPDYNQDGYWTKKGYTQAPLFAAPKPE